jgi:hypothetical protein
VAFSFDRPSAADVLQRTAQKAYVDLIARFVVEGDLRSGPLVAAGRRLQDHVSRLITGALGPPPIRVLALLIQTPICPTLDESAERRLEEPAISPNLHLGTVPLAATAPPSPRDVAVRVAASLTTAVFMPAVLLWATLVLFNIAAAVIVVLAWMFGAVALRRVCGKPVSGLLMLTLTVMAIKTAFTLVTGSTFIYFVQPVFADVTVATLFLGSLATTRPVIARLAPDFYPMAAEVTARTEMRALFRQLTLMWGLVILAKATITFWLLETLSTVNFVLIKGGAVITLTLTAVLVTLVWSVVVGRQTGLLRPAGSGTLEARSSACEDVRTAACEDVSLREVSRRLNPRSHVELDEPARPGVGRHDVALQRDIDPSVTVTVGGQHLPRHDSFGPATNDSRGVPVPGVRQLNVPVARHVDPSRHTGIMPHQPSTDSGMSGRYAVLGTGLRPVPPLTTSRERPSGGQHLHRSRWQRNGPDLGIAR